MENKDTVPRECNCRFFEHQTVNYTEGSYATSADWQCPVHGKMHKDYETATVGGEEWVKEFRSRPFSTPVGEGAKYVGLVCPNCNSQQFRCEGCTIPFIRRVEATARTQQDRETTERIWQIVDGYKEVDKVTGKEKPHEESCCNEVIDYILAAIRPKQEE